MESPGGGRGSGRGRPDPTGRFPRSTRACWGSLDLCRARPLTRPRRGCPTGQRSTERTDPMRKPPLLRGFLSLLLACAGVGSPAPGGPTAQAQVTSQASDHAATEAELKEVLARAEREQGPDHPAAAQSLDNLAGLYRSQGRYAETEPLRRRALAIREKALGPAHPAVAWSLSNLANLYWDQGRFAEAEPLHRRALAIREKALGPDHPAVALSLSNLALLYA